jgi:hypothetical protein
MNTDQNLHSKYFSKNWVKIQGSMTFARGHFLGGHLLTGPLAGDKFARMTSAGKCFCGKMSSGQKS